MAAVQDPEVGVYEVPKPAGTPAALDSLYAAFDAVRVRVGNKVPIPTGLANKVKDMGHGPPGVAAPVPAPAAGAFLAAVMEQWVAALKVKLTVAKAKGMEEALKKLLKLLGSQNKEEREQRGGPPPKSRGVGRRLG